MTRFALAAALAALAVTAIPASAQYGGYYDSSPRYDRDYRPAPRDYDDDDEDYRPAPRRPYYGGRTYRGGASVCTTPRGNCGVNADVSANVPCSCDFRGFGEVAGRTR